MPQFNLGEVALHYEEKGEGQPIIFIHGVWMSGRFFQKQLDGLSDKYRVIALDMRGHGQSTHIHHGHSVAQYAKDVRAFIDGIGLDDVILAGWSMGAFIIWEYIRDYGSEKLKGTIIIDESASDFKWDDWSLGFADFPTLSHLMSAVQSDFGGFVDGFIPLMFREEPSEADFRWMHEEITRVPPTIAGVILFDQTAQDYRPLLSSIAVPTLLAFGRDEKLISIAAGEHLHDNIPDSRLEIFENSSHCPFLEEPEAFNHAVDAFVQSLG